MPILFAIRLSWYFGTTNIGLYAIRLYAAINYFTENWCPHMTSSLPTRYSFSNFYLKLLFEPHRSTPLENLKTRISRFEIFKRDAIFWCGSVGSAGFYLKAFALSWKLIMVLFFYSVPQLRHASILFFLRFRCSTQFFFSC